MPKTKLVSVRPTICSFCLPSFGSPQSFTLWNGAQPVGPSFILESHLVLILSSHITKKGSPTAIYGIDFGFRNYYLLVTSASKLATFRICLLRKGVVDTT